MWGGGVGQLPSAIFSTIRFVVPDYPFFGHRPFPGNGYIDAQTTILCPERMKPGVDPGLRTMRHDGRSERQYFRFLRELHIADIGPQPPADAELDRNRSEKHTSELQSLMRISSAVFCLKKKKSKIQKRIQ